MHIHCPGSHLLGPSTLHECEPLVCLWLVPRNGDGLTADPLFSPRLCCTQGTLVLGSGYETWGVPPGLDLCIFNLTVPAGSQVCPPAMHPVLSSRDAPHSHWSFLAWPLQVRFYPQQLGLKAGDTLSILNATAVVPMNATGASCVTYYFSTADAPNYSSVSLAFGWAGLTGTGFSIDWEVVPIEAPANYTSLSASVARCGSRR